jgi:LytS/YehU family sensor histidine kinase
MAPVDVDAVMISGMLAGLVCGFVVGLLTGMEYRK